MFGSICGSEDVEWYITNLKKGATFMANWGMSASPVLLIQFLQQEKVEEYRMVIIHGQDGEDPIILEIDIIVMYKYPNATNCKRRHLCLRRLV